MKLCKCGCGAPVSRQFVSGHNARGSVFSDAHKQNISEGLKRSWAGDHAGRSGNPSRKGWLKRTRLPVGSTYLDGHGYVRVKVTPGKGRWVGQHKIVMEEMLGRSLSAREIVHHINGDRADNRPANLYLCRDRAHHNAVHRSQDVALRALLSVGRVVFREGLYEAVL